MIRHLMRLVWNRKRQNLLLAFEILLSFLVPFTVVHLTVVNIGNFIRPLGFNADRLWTVELRYPHAGPLDPKRPAAGGSMEDRQRAEQTLRRIDAALSDLPNIERYAATWPSTAYDGGGWGGTIGNTKANSWMNFADDNFRDVMGLKVVAGRWFMAEDQAVPWQSIVINQRLARELFGDDDPLNRTIPFSTGGVPPMRVVGVIDDFRQGGEFAQPANYTFHRLRSEGAASQALPNSLTMRVTPSTTAEFEEKLVKTLEAVAPSWSFEVQTLESKRDSRLHDTLNPLSALGVIAIFLLVMVALGLTGVVWQSVTARFQEFGLRRANGATIQDVRLQVLGELALLTSLALAIGLVVIIQLPFVVAILNAGSFSPPPPTVTFASVAVSVAVIYLLTLLCGWYPSRLATRMQPAEALHYE